MASRLSFLVRIGIAGFAAAVGLAGCARYQPGNSLTCPRAVFVDGTDRLTRFAPGTVPAPANAVAEFQLVDLVHSCRLNRREALATVEFSILAGRRDTALAATHEVPFFVAVTDANGAIIAKHFFTARPNFQPGIGAVTIAEEIQERLPLTEGRRAVGYELIVGFQVSPTELDYNLNRNR